MSFYEPNAIYIENGEEKKLFTYDSAWSIEDAMRAIEVWKYDYKYPIDKAWIDVRESGRVIARLDVEFGVKVCRNRT